MNDSCPVCDGTERLLQDSCPLCGEFDVAHAEATRTKTYKGKVWVKRIKKSHAAKKTPEGIAASERDTKAPQVFDNLTQLFQLEAKLSKRAMKDLEDKDLHALTIPVCQHNMYKYSPYHVERLTATTFLVSFPANKLSLFEALDIPGDSPVFKNLPDGIQYVSNTKEDDGKPLLCFVFSESPGFTIQDLCNQIYLTNANLYNFDAWYDVLKDTEIAGRPVVSRAQLVTLQDYEIEEIVRMHDQSSQGRYLGQVMHDVLKLASALRPRVGDTFAEAATAPCFFKLSTRSAKDSLFYKEARIFAAISKSGSNALQRCQARSLRDVVSAMVCSGRVAQDCKAYLQWRVKPQHKKPLFLVLQPWVEFPTKMELRCWIFRGQLTAINPVAYPTYFSALESSTLRNSISDAAQLLVQETHCKLPWDSYILDIIYDEASASASICEYNPWGPHSSTGSQLFSYELDRDILFGKNCQPEFRIIRPGMKMTSMFDLAYHGGLFQPSERFALEIKAATQQCPCCPRPWSREQPPTQVVPFCSRVPNSHRVDAGYLVESPSNRKQRSGASADDGPDDIQSSTVDSIQLKMVLLVREDLSMSPGKLAVQCSHAAVGCFEKASRTRPDWTNAWLAPSGGQKKVALSVPSLHDLKALQISAGAAQLPYFAVFDAGRTHLKDGTKTVVAIGPAPQTIIDPICSGLKLHR